MRSSVEAKTRGTFDSSRPVHQLRQIVVPVDLTSDSRESIDYAIHFAKTFGSSLNLIHLYQEPYVLNEGFRSRSCDLFKQQRQKVCADFYNLLRETRNKYSDSIGYFEYGNPDREIDVIARQLHADLLVVSMHNGKWLEHLLFGRHADRILANVPCPVLFVREGKRDHPRRPYPEVLKR
jgi:nucleotide-binding universal stress UspA family protein